VAAAGTAAMTQDQTVSHDTTQDTTQARTEHGVRTPNRHHDATATITGADDGFELAPPAGSHDDHLQVTGLGEAASQTPNDAITDTDHNTSGTFSTLSPANDRQQNAQELKAPTGAAKASHIDDPPPPRTPSPAQAPSAAGPASEASPVSLAAPAMEPPVQPAAANKLELAQLKPGQTSLTEPVAVPGTGTGTLTVEVTAMEGRECDMGSETSSADRYQLPVSHLNSLDLSLMPALRMM
jgi:hypothetical protein